MAASSASSCDTVGQLRCGHSDGILGLAAEVAAQGLDDRLATHGGLHQVQLRLLQTAAGGGEFVLVDGTLATQLLQSGPAGPHGFELTAMAVTQGGQERVQSGLGLGHDTQQTLHRRGVRLQSGPALGRLLALLGVTGQSTLDLTEALGQHPPALDQSGRAHLPLGTGPGRLGQESLDASALLPGVRHPAGGLDPGVLECGHAGDELTHAGGIASDAILELGAIVTDLLQLGGEQVPVAGHPLATHPCGLVGDLVPVVGPNRLGCALAGGLDLGPRRLTFSGGSANLALGHLGPVACLVDHGCGDDATAGPDAPSRG